MGLDGIDISIENVVKSYSFQSVASNGLKHLILHFPSYIRKLRQGTSFRALDGVSFDVTRGECFGVIGRNGSGKSTLLGLIAGVLAPTSGTVSVRRRVSPLLELGAGFHPDFTGRENILLNGVLLGLTRREVRERMDEIAAFSELGEFIDRPLRTYSSGMIARLGFSVIVHLSPEILLIDEVLAVGDESFQAKCLAKIQEFRSRGTTIVFVSHDLVSVKRICERVALVDSGRIVEIGTAESAIAAYHRVLAQRAGKMP